MREEIALAVVLFVVVFVIILFIEGRTMNEKELKILIIAYACVVIGTILITGKWW